MLTLIIALKCTRSYFAILILMSAYIRFSEINNNRIYNGCNDFINNNKNNNNINATISWRLTNIVDTEKN